MKRWVRLAAAVLIPILLFSSLYSCGAEPGAGKVQTIKIGVAVYRKDDTFISSLCTYLEQIAKNKEIESGKKIVLNIVDGQSNQALQNDQVDNFISHDYDVICVNEVDRTAAAVIVNKVKAAGIPLIFFNREPVEEDLRMWDKAYYVGADAAQSGRLQGEIVVNAWKQNKALDKNGDGKMQYVMLEGEQDHQDALLRTEYSLKAVTGAGIHVEKLADDIANWQRAQATSKMTQWIQKFGSRIEVVLANNDDMALGAIDAIRDSNLQSKPIVLGIDATQPGLKAIEDGSLFGTVFNDPRAQAQAIFDLSYSYATGVVSSSAVKMQSGRYVRVPYREVTKENYQDILDYLR
jgi:ABC-type sugar transport system, periplasmic component